ncbi:MAG: dimethylamine dehydrogenase [Actinobacteria bacterium]|nr:dimethylamine dehydrogenase [Actinomycetota bacterium]
MSAAPDSRYAVLFEPLEIGPRELPNRFFQVPYLPGFTASGRPRVNAAHRAVKAEGGWGAVCTEWCMVAPDADPAPEQASTLLDDADERNLASWCAQVQAHGALAGIELAHDGANAGGESSRWPAVAPSQLRSDAWLFSEATPKEMERADIERIQAAWAAAAARAVRAGFDIVYVYGAASMLPMQFLSPFTNKRTDGYGGSFENRARFWLETLEAVRGAVAGRAVVAARIGVDQLGPSGLGVEEVSRLVGLADPLVDLWDVNVGGLANSDMDLTPSRVFEEGYSLQWTTRIKAATRKPLVTVGRLTNADLMADLVRQGKVDIIGAARPSIADPFLPAKVRAGRFEDIRECIGSNHCALKATTGHLACSQNATAGEEHRRGWHPERFPRLADTSPPVAVIGAGPAGLECAKVLGRRGMELVHMVDAEREMGGHLGWFGRLPGFQPWLRLVDYRRTQIEKLPGVTFVPGTRLEVEDVLDYGASIVVCATGSRWSADGINLLTHAPIPGAGAGLAHVLTPEQIVVEGKRPPGPEVVIYDCEGYLTGLGIAQFLQREGCRPTIVTPVHEAGAHAFHSGEGPVMRREVHAAGGAFRHGLRLVGIEPGGARCEDEFGGAVEIDADAVVLVTQRLSEDRLYRDLLADPDRLAAAGIEAVYRAGDCVAPRLLPDAIFDGHRLAMEIDGPDPATPQPLRRDDEEPPTYPDGPGAGIGREALGLGTAG